MAQGRAGNALCASLKWWCLHLPRCQPQARATFTRGFGAKPSRVAPRIARLRRPCQSNRFLFPETNLPFDRATRCLVGSKEQLACSATREHYPRSALSRSYHHRPPTASTFTPDPKKGTGKMQGWIDLRSTNQHI